MGSFSETLTIDEIVEMNRQAIEAFGGLPFAGINNLKEEGILSVTLDSIEYEIFGVQQYPTIEEKAAVLGWRIMTGHVFHDGNKRTGLLACMTFLAINGLDLQVSFENVDEDVLLLCEGIADNRISLDEFTEWVRSRVIPFDSFKHELISMIRN